MEAIEGSIPAPAGEPPRIPDHGTLQRVYPRACGGTGVGTPGGRPIRGLSPRLRGNRFGVWTCLAVAGSIPAPAGEPVHSRRTARPSPVYPRACGGTRPFPAYRQAVAGLSPRLRGNPSIPGVPPGRRRSIPAPAGEPCSQSTSGISPGVYPRACGGTSLTNALMTVANGLSPRLRGNQVQT